MFKKTKEKDGVTIVTRVRNEIVSKICLIMEIVSGIREYAPVDFDIGTGMDRTVDGVFNEWSGGVRRGPGASDEVRRDAVARKLRKEAGLQGKWREMEGNG